MRGLVVVAVLGLAACSDDDGGTAKCDDQYGQPTEDAIEAFDNAPCSDDGEDQGFITASIDCDDGTALYWNDHGWGQSGGEWTEHENEDLTPPTTDC